MQTYFIWAKFEWFFTSLFTDNFYTRMLAAQMVAGALFVGIFWAVLTLNFVLIFAIILSNWIQLTW